MTSLPSSLSLSTLIACFPVSGIHPRPDTGNSTLAISTLPAWSQFCKCFGARYNSGCLLCIHLQVSPPPELHADLLTPDSTDPLNSTAERKVQRRRCACSIAVHPTLFTVWSQDPNLDLSHLWRLSSYVSVCLLYVHNYSMPASMSFI